MKTADSFIRLPITRIDKDQSNFLLVEKSCIEEEPILILDLEVMHDDCKYVLDLETCIITKKYKGKEVAKYYITRHDKDLLLKGEETGWRWAVVRWASSPASKTTKWELKSRGFLHKTEAENWMSFCKLKCKNKNNKFQVVYVDWENGFH